MLIKYIILMYLIIPDLNDSLSIRKDIDMAKQFLEYYGIPDPKLCKIEQVTAFCSKTYAEICTVRLLGKKVEFKQFENPCYMELNNICESQDNIWAIKNSGPCVMNENLRRFAKAIEKMAKENTTTTASIRGNETETTEPDDITENDTEVTEDETTADENDVDETTLADDTDDTDATEDEREALREADENETEAITEETVTEMTTDADETTFAIAEVGKVFYDDGSVKALREAEVVRFPPTRAKMTYNRVPCAKRIKPCPDLYNPVCLYYAKEKPNNVTYYYFVNSCEAQQFTCYHPEYPIEGSSSVRAGYCAHIQYINYARYAHTISAWGHYGWLHGPWPFNHILKPHERA